MNLALFDFDGTITALTHRRYYQGKERTTAA